MAKKLRVGILFGGRSGEHEVSLLSAASILKAIDRRKFEVLPIGIDKSGRWLTGDAAQALLTGTLPPLDGLIAETIEAEVADGSEDAPLAEELAEVAEVIDEAANADSAEAADKIAGEKAECCQEGGCGDDCDCCGDEVECNCFLDGQTCLASQEVDVVFPVLHGTFGEDGTMQGLFELADLAYVGSGVLGSSAGMDKDVMKRLFAQAKLPLVKHVTLLRAAWEKSPIKAVAAVESALKYPVFVKPANLGSSVGISKAHNRKELKAALALASKYDRKLVVEQGVGGKAARAREFEVAVLGNDTPQASVVGEIVPAKEFYDYEAKYLSEGSVPVIPAKLTKAESKQIREMAVAAFQACDLAGLARADFLMEPDGKRRIYLNEVNTLPGFTKISMYPKLWEASGIKYKELITRLIELAIERRAEKARTIYSLEG
jgi:D-alanine-D-alanine ligase